MATATFRPTRHDLDQVAMSINPILKGKIASEQCKQKERLRKQIVLSLQPKPTAHMKHGEQKYPRAKTTKRTLEVYED